MPETIFAWISQYGYTAIFLMLMLGILGLPLPDETILTFSGYLLFKGRLHPVPTMVAAVLGSACGISLSYLLGRTFGLKLLHRYGRYIRLNEEHLKRVHAWFEKRGKWTLTFGYFVPGVRHVTAYIAGTSELHLGAFALFAYSGAILWASTFLSLGYLVGEQWSRATEEFHRYALFLTAGIAVGAAVWLLIRKWLKGRKAG